MGTPVTTHDREPITPPRVLTIAGSDSGGGAGIQADLKTFEARGVYGMSVLTALTAQNTLGVQGVHEVPPDFVRQQLDSVADDIGIDAAKTGMLASADIIAAVADGIVDHGLETLVVDPVAASKHGDPLLREDATDALRDRILPLALVATPNVGEVSLLSGVEVKGRDDLRDAAEAFLELGPRWVLVKGGHLPDSEAAVDLLTDGDTVEEITAERLDTRDTHGTGCTLSSAIAAELAKGADVPDAVVAAKRYLTGALRRGVRIGEGIGPVDHQWERR
ncbi:MAG: bifunctional hydroxymethylpyrimidine kinase/phosphomethylpyrimidine kinase [Nitriliruptorales bacterium]|nr:bifunctional hydroxymethylpyrimidine kinase/phosphomethylpyrimidine kinase [Nitriliruptorales bacterium]